MNCYICKGELKLLGSIPFDTNCLGVPIVNTTPVSYYRCSNCDFICCPEMLAWDNKTFSDKVYNDNYILYDPEYSGKRALNTINNLQNLFGAKPKKIRHLDYGSGNGLVSKSLKEQGWDSEHYDPYSSPTKPSGEFNVITAIEVFEHSINIYNTLEDIKTYIGNKKGVVLFTTIFGDSTTDINWDYIAPRNGHVGILSVKAMKMLADKYGFILKSFDKYAHFLYTDKNALKLLIRRS